MNRRHWVAGAVVVSIAVAIIVSFDMKQRAASLASSTASARAQQREARRAELLARASAFRGESLHANRVAVRAGRVQGVVTDERGDVLADALVCASCVACDMGVIANAPRCVRTGSDGSYRLDDLPLGKQRISISARGHRPRLLHAGHALVIGDGDAAERSLDARVEPGGASVSGVVRDALGGAVGFATVRALYADVGDLPPGAGVGSVTTADAEGRFAVDVAAGLVRLVALADGYAPGEATRIAPADGVQLVLTPAASIRGQLVTEREGRPVADVVVRAKSEWLGEQTATSDAHGEFVIGGLSPGNYYLRAEAPGWLGENDGPVSVELAKGVDGVLIAMYPAVRVAGVLSVAGKPCASGHVSVGPSAENGSVPHAGQSTDSDGSITFTALPPGTYATRLACAGYGEQAGAPLIVGAEDLLNVSWTMDAGAGVTALAIDARGRAVAGADLQISPAQPPAANGAAPDTRRYQSGAADATGRFTFRGMLPGVYAIGGRYVRAPVRVELVAGQIASVEVPIAATGDLVVTATSPDGAPLQDVGVAADSVDGTPGASGVALGGGRFRVGPLAVGKYVVSVRDGRNPRVDHPVPVEVIAGDATEVSVVYGGYTGVIRGRARLGDAAPLADAWVSATSMDQARDPYASTQQMLARMEGSRVLTDRDGSFTLTGLDPAGSFGVVVEHASGAQAKRDGIRPDGAALDILVAAPGRVVGKVRTESGQPITSFYLQVHNTTTDSVSSMQPFTGRSDGSFQLDNVAAGALEIIGVDQEGRQGRVGVALQPSTTLTGVELLLAAASAAR